MNICLSFPCPSPVPEHFELTTADGSARRHERRHTYEKLVPNLSESTTVDDGLCERPVHDFSEPTAAGRGRRVLRDAGAQPPPLMQFRTTHGFARISTVTEGGRMKTMIHSQSMQLHL